MRKLASSYRNPVKHEGLYFYLKLKDLGRQVMETLYMIVLRFFRKI